jgi:hemerythrin superfamily protein
MSSDAIVVLRADHKEIRNLFREFRAAGDKAVKKKSKIVGQIIELLTVHTYIENEVMYPEVCALLPDPQGRRAGVLRRTSRGRRLVHGTGRHAGWGGAL